jgi:competence protein ComGC
VLNTIPTAGRSCPVRDGDESGFTLVEMMISSLLTLVILTMMMTTIPSFGRAETSTVNSDNAAANVRLTLLNLQHDIQSANPLETLSTVAAYNDELQMTIEPSDTLITWQYDSSTQLLTRQSGTFPPVVELTGVTNGDPLNGGLPVFGYYDHCAINQVDEPQATAASISAATTVVQVTLSVANLNSAPYGTTTRVSIMNQPPGASRCG